MVDPRPVLEGDPAPMKISGSIAQSQFAGSANWRSLQDSLARDECADECVVRADDWAENVSFQLVSVTGAKTDQLVYTCRALSALSPPRLRQDLRALVAG